MSHLDDRLMRPVFIAIAVLAIALPRAAFACIYWPPDLFAPMPACNTHSDAQTVGQASGLREAAIKLATFEERVRTARSEVQQWQVTAEQVRSFTDRVRFMQGEIGQVVDPLPSFVAEFNRESTEFKYVLTTQLNGLPQYSRISLSSLIDSVKVDLGTAAGFNRVYALDSVYQTMLGAQRQGYGAALQQAALTYQRSAGIDSTAARLAISGDSIGAYYASKTDGSGLALAKLVLLGGDLNQLRGSRLTLAQRVQAARLDVVRSMASVRDDANQREAVVSILNSGSVLVP